VKKGGVIIGIQEVAGHIYTNLDYLPANVACIDTGDGLVLVDTPTLPEEISHWKDFVDSLKPKKVEYIIATHQHFDHVIGNNRLGGKVIMQEEAAESMQQPGGTLREDFAPNLPDITKEQVDFIISEPLVQPAITFGYRMSLKMGDLNIRLFRVGGHSSGSLCVYVEEDKILLTGDNVSAGRHPFRGTADHLEWIEALKWMKDLDIDTIIPGHGELCGKEELDRLIEYLSRLWYLTEDLVKKGMDRESVIDESRNRMFDFFDVEPEMVDEATFLFNGGASRLYDEILAKVGK
jgi:cyclase